MCWAIDRRKRAGGQGYPGVAEVQEKMRETISRSRICPGQLPAAGGLSCDPTKLNVLLVFCPIEVMAAIQTTMIKANITAYSTAVGPSSFFRKFTTHLPARRGRSNMMIAPR
jgi:hypothetical protein